MTLRDEIEDAIEDVWSADGGYISDQIVNHVEAIVFKERARLVNRVEAVLREAEKAPEAMVRGPRRISIAAVRAALYIDPENQTPTAADIRHAQEIWTEIQ